MGGVGTGSINNDLNNSGRGAQTISSDADPQHLLQRSGTKSQGINNKKSSGSGVNRPGSQVSQRTSSGANATLSAKGGALPPKPESPPQ